MPVPQQAVQHYLIVWGAAYGHLFLGNASTTSTSKNNSNDGMDIVCMSKFSLLFSALVHNKTPTQYP